MKWKRSEIPDSKLRNVTIFSASTYFERPINSSVLEKCPKEVKESCFITNNKLFFSKADAVFFHSLDISKETLNEFNSKRQSQIPYVIMTQENPYNAYIKEFKNDFNWTMTYRTDSDVHYPYGALVKNERPVDDNFTEIWNSKTKSALWLNSNRGSLNRRTQLVEKLKAKGMDIDLMGSFYKNVPVNCPRKNIYDDCNLEIHSPYKFYMAFENGNCKDYVTEKFWRKAGLYNMVPIVMSRNIYREIGIPDSMYISIDDFPNLGKFMDYVAKVSSNQTEYLKFHEWRRDFRIVDNNEDNYGYCQLCQKLMDSQRTPIVRKSYENLMTWHGKSTCDNSLADRYL